MAKKKPTKKAEEYQYCRAIVDADGSLRWEYKLKGNPMPGRMNHDEDVSEWTDQDIINLTRQLFAMQPDERVEVQHE